MGKQTLTLKLDPKSATLAYVRRKLKLRADDVDDEFGVISIDPKRDLYAVLVEDRAADKAAKQSGVQGPFSNPKIEPFGPPKKAK
jgi:hypothetical protein